MPLPLLCDAQNCLLLFDKLFLRRSEGSNGSLSQFSFKLEAVFIVPTLGFLTGSTSLYNDTRVKQQSTPCYRSGEP